MEDLNIIVQAILEKESLKTIKSQLDEIKTKYGNLTINLNIDQHALTALTNISNSINKVTQSTQAQAKAIEQETQAFNQATEAQKKYNVEKDKIIENDKKIQTYNTTGNKFNNITTETTYDKTTGESKLSGTTVQNIDSAGKDRAILADHNKMLTEAYKMNADFDKKAEDLDKAHYQALKTNADRIEALDKMHYMALKQNRELDYKNHEKNVADYNKLVDEAYKHNDSIKKRELDLDKAHYQALEQNTKRENDINDTKIALQTKIDNMQRRFGTSINTEGLDALSTRVGQIDTRTVNWQRNVKSINQDLDKFAANVKTSGSHMINFAEAFQTALTKFPIWMAASTIFYQSLHYFTEGISYVVELNKSLTEISIVTGKNQQQVGQLGKEYNQLAKDMQVLTKNITDATVEFYRQGLSQEEVMTRTKKTIEYAKISNLDFKKSAEILTATTNSMGISIGRAADVFSYLGDATATGSDEIGIAYQKLGGTAGALHLSFEKTSSWIAVLSSRTREGAETIGQSIKSILARVQSLKEKGFDESDGTQINQVAKALDVVGIALVDKQGQFRNFGNIMDELGAKWVTLDTRQKAYLSTTIAGNFQSSRFLNLMEGYKDTIPLYDKSLESAGTTTRKFALYQEGVAAKIDLLKSTMQGLWQNTFNSEGLKSIIGTITSLVSGVDSIVKTFGFLPPVVALATVAIMLFTKSGLTPLYTMITTIPMKLSLLKLEFQSLALSTNVASASVRMLGVSLMSMATFLAPIAIITGLTYAITSMVSQHQKLVEQQKVLDAQNKQITTSWTTQKDAIKALVTEFNNLDGVSRSIEQEKRYLEITDQLKTLMPNLVASINEKGVAHLKNASAIAKELEYAERLTKLEQQKSLLNAKKDFKTDTSNIADIQDNIQNAKDRMVYHSKDKDAEQKLKSIEIELLNFESLLNGAIDGTKNRVVELATNTATLAGVKVGEGLSAEFKKVADSLDVKSMSPTELASKSVAIGNLAVTLNNLKAASGLVEAQRLNSIFLDQAKAVGLSSDAVKGLYDSFVKSGAVLPTATQQTDTYTASIRDMGKFIKETEKSLKTVNQAIKDVNAGNNLSSDTITQLILDYPQLADQIKTTADGYTIELSALETARQGKIDKYNSDLEAEKNSTLVTLDNTSSRITAYGVELQNIKTLADAKAALNGINTQQTRAKYGVAGVGFGDNLGIAGFNPVQGFINEQDKNADLAVKAINDAIKKVSGATGQIDALKKLLNNHDYGLGKDKTKQPKSDTQASLHNLTDFSKEEIDNINNIIKSRDENIKSLEKQIATAKKVNDYNKELVLTNKLITEQKAKLDDINTANKNLSSSADKVRTTYSDIGKQFASKSGVKFDSWFNSDASASDKYTSTIQGIDKEMQKIEGTGINLTAEQRNQIKVLENQKILYEKIFKEIQATKVSWIGNKDKEQVVKDAIEALLGDLANTQKALQDKRIKNADEASKAVIDVYKKNYEAERDAELSSIEDLSKAEDKRHKSKIDALDDEMKKFQESVDLVNKQIDRASNTDTYDTDLAKLQKEAQDIQNLKNQHSLDNSIEGQAKTVELEKEHAAKLIEIDKLQKDRTKTLRKDSLSDMLDGKKKEVDASKEAENTKFDQYKEVLANTKIETEKYWKGVIDNDATYTKIQQDILAGHFENIRADFQTFADKMKTISKTIGEGIASNITNNQKTATDLLGNYEKNPTSNDITKPAESTPTTPSSNLPVGFNKMSEYDLKDYLKNKEKYENPSSSQGDRIDATNGNKQLREKYGILADSYTAARFKQMASLDTGGMTPSFSGGKLGILHENELIFNKVNTADILKTFDATKNLLSKFINFKVPDYLLNIGNKMAGAGGDTTNQYHFHIANLSGGKQGANELFKEWKTKMDTGRHN